MIVARLLSRAHESHTADGCDKSRHVGAVGQRLGSSLGMDDLEESSNWMQ